MLNTMFYSGLYVIFLDNAAVPRLPTIAAVTAPVKETI